MTFVPIGTNSGDFPVWNASTGKYDLVYYPNPATGQVPTATNSGWQFANP
jgi:hypothetical protein